MFYRIPDIAVLDDTDAEKLGYERVFDDAWHIRKPLDEDGFHADITIAPDGFDVSVWEVIDGEEEEFIPFRIEGNKGAFVGDIRKQVDDALDAVLSEIFKMQDTCAQVEKYMLDKYGTVPEHPWENYPEHRTFKTSCKQKWYGIIMPVRASKLGLAGDAFVTVMNVKASPDRIESLVDGIHLFPAYHMNKKHWISILLDAESDVGQVKKLIDESYELVEPGFSEIPGRI